MRAAILSGELGPETPIVEKTILKTFGGSRASLRDAIRRLTLDGLVVVRPQHGSFVAPIDPYRASGAWDLYLALTLRVISDTTASLSDADLRKIGTHSRALDNSKTAAEAFDAVDALYRVFFLRKGNRAMLNFGRKLRAELERASILLSLDAYRPAQFGKEIFAAASARDVPRILAAVNLQMRHGKQYLRRVDSASSPQKEA